MANSTLPIAVLMAGLLNTILGGFVLYKAPRRKLNVVFSICAFIMSLWALELFMFQMRVGPSTDFWIKVTYLTVWLMSIIFVYYSFIFPFEKYYWFSKITIIFLSLLLLIYFYFLFFTNKFIVNVVDHSTWTEVVLGPAHIWFQIGSAFSYTVFGGNIFWKLKRTRGLEKIQLQLFLAGVFFYSIPVVILTVILPTFFQNTRYLALSPVTSFIFTSFVVYAIFKYRFLGIKFILGKFLYYVLVALVHFTSFYLMFSLQTKLWGSIFSPEALISGFGIALVYLFIFSKLDKLIRKFLEKTLIYADYDPVEVLENLGNIITTEQDLEKVVIKILSLIKDSLSCRRIGLVLFEKDKVLYENLIGFDLEVIRNMGILKDIDKLLIYDETISQGKVKGLKKILNLMKKEDIAILLPFNSKEDIRGVILIGYKKNQEAYTVQDIDLLENIAAKVSTTISKFFITTSDVNEALRNFSSPHLLKSSNLLRLKQVQKSSKERNISKVDALCEIIKEAIRSFRPEDEGKKRTATRLKYEILKMIAFEGAVESQIMWELGFDVYTRSVEEKLSERREPRFKLKDASEYAATSARSFKRLKKEAVEMLGWKLENVEGARSYIRSL